MIKKLIILLVIAGSTACWFYFDLNDLLTLEYLKSRYQDLLTAYESNTASFIAMYFLLYVIATALSLPGGATLMTLAGGAVFGLWVGTLIVSFASTLGATLAFLVARYLFRDAIQEKFGESLRTVNKGVEKDGVFYLFTLRLIPVFPFFLINLLMALTPIKTFQFFWVSQLGMLGGTLVYVNAGTQLSKLNSLSDILSFELILAFSLLGIFPLIAKLLVNHLQKLKVYKGWEKPKNFDRNLVVIGAGAAGLVTSYIAATVRSKVSLVESSKMGGDCLNTGCVPSKALIRSAKINSYIDRSNEFGIEVKDRQVHFDKVMQRVHEVIEKIEPHDSIERYTELGVDCIQGYATIKSPFEVEVNGKTLRTKNIVVATGARPFVPPITGLEEAGYYTSENLWEITELPERIAVLGGGPIGCELTQAFGRLGAEVSQIEMMPRLMIREDTEVSEYIKNQFEKESIHVLVNHEAIDVTPSAGEKIITCKHKESGGTVEVRCDAIICAVGRSPNTTGFGLEELGIETGNNGTITVNDFMQTRYPNIFACGDVAGPYQFTHVAAHQAWYASVNALFGKFKKFRVDYSVIPWCTYTDPEVARVGLNEQEAVDRNIAFEVTRYDIDDLDRAIAESEDHGFIKVLTVPGKDKILGVTIVGQHAGELVSEYVLAMKNGIGLNKILGTIHIYPTFAESNKYVAGEWKKNHKPERILDWLERFHTRNLK